MATKGWMPKYLAKPISILWWDLDVFLPPALILLLGLLLNALLTSFIIMLIYVNMMKIYRRNLPDGFLGNLCYFLGLKSLKGYPHYIENNFRE